MQPDHLALKRAMPSSDANGPISSGLSRHIGTKAFPEPATDDLHAGVRHPCGLTWHGACPGWPLIVRILWWAMRHSRD